MDTSFLFATKVEKQPQDKLLDAALILFSEKGYRDTTVLDIVAYARVSKTTFYNFYKTKEELLAHLFETLLEEVLAMIKLAAQRETVITEKAYAGIKRYVEICVREHEVARLLLVSSVGISDAIEELRKQAYDRFALFIFETVRTELGFTDSASDEEIYLFSQAMVGAINQVVIQQVLLSKKQIKIDYVARFLNRIVVGSYMFLLAEQIPLVTE
ncbi:TetR/AcrR family transcriptional regulator [Pueribacillus sp. YX66]|uniref:TetR/AcrR family transcriptional regulator n=1 Tax=Pueribacillus sp. YX66 TaxID=3229242 RepID=UPI00358D26F1